VTPSTDLLFELLADRRRHILHCLTDHPNGVADSLTSLMPSWATNQRRWRSGNRSHESLSRPSAEAGRGRGHRLRYAKRNRPLQPAAAPRGMPGEHPTRTVRWRLIGSDCCFGRCSASMHSRDVPGEASDDWLTLSFIDRTNCPYLGHDVPLGSRHYRLYHAAAGCWHPPNPLACSLGKPAGRG